MTELRAKSMENQAKTRIFLNRFAAFEQFVEERRQLLERTPRQSATNGITVCGNVVVLDAWRRQATVGQEDES